MQYMKSDSGESGIIQLLLGMNFFYSWGILIYYVFGVHPLIIFKYPIIEFCLYLVWIIVCRLCNNVYNSKGKKWCPLIGFLFREGVDVIAYLTTLESQLS